MEPTTPLLRACSMAGSQSALAATLGVTPPTVNQWVKGARPVPDDLAAAIERATSGAVTCDQLRPDVAWSRIQDPEWPHPSGRPVIDIARKEAERAAA